jgi:hypothetical protein
MLRELRAANMSQLGRDWLEGSVHGLQVVLEDQEVDLAEDSVQLATTMSGAGALAPHQKRVRRRLWAQSGWRACSDACRRPAAQWSACRLEAPAAGMQSHPPSRPPSHPPAAAPRCACPQVMSNLLRVKQVVQQRIKRLGAARTGEFLSAAAHGDTQRVRAMLEQHLSPDVADYDGGHAGPARSTPAARGLRSAAQAAL